MGKAVTSRKRPSRLRKTAAPSRTARADKDAAIDDTKKLRTWLAGNMLKVASGEQPAHVANAVCGYAQQIYNTMNIELKQALAAQKLGKSGIRPVKLDG